MASQSLEQEQIITYSELPADTFGKCLSVQEFLQTFRRDLDSKNIQPQEMFSNLYLHRPFIRKKQNQQKRCKKRFGRKERKAHNMLKLPRSSWDYEQLQKMHAMWTCYMHDNLKAFAKVPNVEADNQYTAFHTILTKCDLIGAHVTVAKSKVPSCIAISGIIVLETKQTFQVVTRHNQLKILLKAPSVFVFEWRNMQFTAYGKALLSRAHERAIKKVKSCIDLDL